MLKEFKAFALKGNVVDLTVGVIVGAAFGKIVSSLVSDIIMPPIGWVLGGIDFAGLVITLKAATADTAALTINYGIFLNTVIDFVIISFVIFIVVKQLRIFHLKEAEKPVPPTEEVLLLREIRDALKQK